jgi:hypothetical protein
MNERDFIYWLIGFLESGNLTSLNEDQVKTIKEHLTLVVTKVTPHNYGITPDKGVLPGFPSSKTQIIC